jgi:hypothetical protein
MAGTEEIYRRQEHLLTDGTGDTRISLVEENQSPNYTAKGSITDTDVNSDIIQHYLFSLLRRREA